MNAMTHVNAKTCTNKPLPPDDAKQRGIVAANPLYFNCDKPPALLFFHFRFSTNETTSM